MVTFSSLSPPESKCNHYVLHFMFPKSDPFAAGTQFQCLLDIVPIKNEKHEVVLFLASHKDVTKNDSDNNPSDDEEQDGDVMPSPAPTSDSSSNPYQRRRSRAVLYQLSGHYRRSDNVKSKLNLNNVSIVFDHFCHEIHIITHNRSSHL